MGQRSPRCVLRVGGEGAVWGPFGKDTNSITSAQSLTKTLQEKGYKPVSHLNTDTKILKNS